MKPERSMRVATVHCRFTRRRLMTLQTALAERLGLRSPVIAAPLGRGSTAQFLAALAGEGAMGFVALMHMPEPEVRQTLSGYIAAVGAGDRFGVNLTLIVDQTRRLEAALGSALAAWPLAARAQQPERVRRIGVLVGLAENDPEMKERIAGLRQGLEKFGWGGR